MALMAFSLCIEETDEFDGPLTETIRQISLFFLPSDLALPAILASCFGV